MIPLCVEVTGDAGARHITREIASLRFRKTAPGGFGPASCSLHHPLAVNDPLIKAFSRLRITDGRHGGVIHEGLLVDPAQAVSEQGQLYELTVDGPSSLASAREEAVLYIDQRLEPWRRSGTDTTNQFFKTDSGTYSDNRPTLDTSVGRNVVVGLGYLGAWHNEMFNDAGQHIARVSFSWLAEKADTDWEVRLRLRDAVSGGATTDAYTADFQTGGVAVAKVITTDWPATRAIVALVVRSKAAVTVLDDTTYARFMSIIVRGTLYSAAGAELTAAASYTTNTVKAHEIVADVIGRFLPEVDGAGATIDTSGTYTITSLVYPDAVTPAKILEDMMGFEPTYWWGIYEANTAGQYRFAWQPYDLNTRYVIPPDAGFSSSTSSVELLNRVIVRYVDASGQRRTVTRTAANATLDAAGLIRSRTIDAGDNIHTSTDAARIGDQYLTQHASPGNAGTLYVAQPVVDLLTGRTVMPWEIEPGYVVQVPGVAPNPDVLNATGADGFTRFLSVAMEYDSDTAMATLELDNNALEASIQLAQQRRALANRRRR
jgi:hypothetical protein